VFCDTAVTALPVAYGILLCSTMWTQSKKTLMQVKMLPWGYYGMLPPARNLKQRIMEYLRTGKSLAWEDYCRSTFDRFMKICF